MVFIISSSMVSAREVETSDRSNQGIWEVKNSWSEDWENKYSEWIQNEVNLWSVVAYAQLC